MSGVLSLRPFVTSQQYAAPPRTMRDEPLDSFKIFYSIVRTDLLSAVVGEREAFAGRLARFGPQLGVVDPWLSPYRASGRGSRRSSHAGAAWYCTPRPAYGSQVPKDWG